MLQEDRPGLRRRRLSADAREAEIVRAATAYFCEVGHAGTTHELARRIGISQPLLYRYFPTKQSLLDRVYVELHRECWRPEWRDRLLAREPDLATRLNDFYLDYMSRVYQRQWMRIFLFTALYGEERQRNQSYVAMVERDVIDPIAVVTRRARVPGTPDDAPLAPIDRELAWTLHGSAFFLGFRREVIGDEQRFSLERAIGILICRHLGGAPAVAKLAGGGAA